MSNQELVYDMCIQTLCAAVEDLCAQMSEEGWEYPNEIDLLRDAAIDAMQVIPLPEEHGDCALSRGYEICDKIKDEWERRLQQESNEHHITGEL